MDNPMTYVNNKTYQAWKKKEKKKSTICGLRSVVIL